MVTKNGLNGRLTATKTKPTPKKRAERDARGRFVDCPGPGRPSRPIEREYLAYLSDAVPLKRWAGIVDKVVDLAEAGERWAVEWLSKYLLGDMSLTDLAVRDMLGIDRNVELRAACQDRMMSEFAKSIDLENLSVLQRAVRILAAEDAEED